MVKQIILYNLAAHVTGQMPYRYVGILHINNVEEFQQKDAPSKKFQDFQAKWMTMVNPDFQIFMG